MLSDLLEAYGVEYDPQNARGWVHITCPHCDDTGRHLGISTRGAATCWRCGASGRRLTLSLALGVPLDGIERLEATYGLTNGLRATVRPVEEEIDRKPFAFPDGVTPCGKRHKRYLESRGLDPDKVIKQWGFQACGPTARLDKLSFRNRLLIPVTWDGQVVTYQARDVTGKQSIRYLSCPKDRERRSIKTIFYGDYRGWTSGRIILVEGPGDVWRLGRKSIAVMGTQTKRAQIREIAKRFRRVCLLFDPEPAAQKIARGLAAELRMRGVEAFLGDLPEGKDPGDLSESEASDLVNAYT